MKQKEASLCDQSFEFGSAAHCATLGKVSDPGREVRMRPSHRAAVRSPDQHLGCACVWSSWPLSRCLSSHLSSYFSILTFCSKLFLSLIQV